MRPSIRACAAVGLAILCGGASVRGLAPGQDALPAGDASALELRGVVIVLDHPERSTCLIGRGAGSKDAAPFGLGDRVFGIASLLDIQIDHVLVRNARTGLVERVEWGPAADSRAASASLPVPAVAIRPGAPAPEIRVEIPREQADYYRGHLPDFLGSARSALRFDEAGALIGFSIRDVVPGGPVGRLGIRDGDVLLGVNGVRLDGMAKLLALLPSLTSLTSVDLLLLRAGRPLTVGYRIR